MVAMPLLALLLVLTALLSASEDPGELSIRPAFPLDAPACLRLRAIAAGDPAAATVVAAAIAAGEPLLPTEPAPLVAIRYEGLVNTDPQRIADVARLRSLDAVAALLQAWQASGEERFAAALHRHVAAWAATYRPTGNDVNENKLTPLLAAWRGLRATAPPAEATTIDGWIADLGTRHATAVAQSQHLTNRYTKHVRLAVYCGLALDRREWVQLGRTGLQRFVAGSLRADGSSLDLERRDTLTYHCSALVPALELALVLGADGRDLYAWTAPGAGSLKASVDYVVPYARGEKTRQEWRNTTVELDRQRAAAGLEHYRPGRLFRPEEAADLLEAASAFDPALIPLWAQLAKRPPGGGGSWRMLVQLALAP